MDDPRNPNANLVPFRKSAVVFSKQGATMYIQFKTLGLPFLLLLAIILKEPFFGCFFLLMCNIPRYLFT